MMKSGHFRVRGWSGTLDLNETRRSYAETTRLLVTVRQDDQIRAAKMSSYDDSTEPLRSSDLDIASAFWSRWAVVQMFTNLRLRYSLRAVRTAYVFVAPSAHPVGLKGPLSRFSPCSELVPDQRVLQAIERARCCHH